MNDEELPINELASAYLDDELDAAERAAASADPEVMATVESFARVRSALSDAAPVDGNAKDAAVAAALAEFDARQRVATAAVPAATVTSMQARRRAYRALTGVAAAVAILAIGIAAINGARGGDTKSSAVRVESAPTGAIAPSAADAPQSKAAADTGAAAGTAAPSAETVAAASQAGNATALAPAAVTPQVDTREALVQYAAGIEGATASSPQAPTTTVPASGTFGTPPIPCLTSHQQVLGGPITVNGVPAYAVRDTSNGALQAIKTTDCVVLLEVPGP